MDSRAAGRPDFDELLESYGRLLRNAIARTCPKHLGLQFDDIEQEARLRLWRALQGETEIGNPASYLYRIAVSATIDAVRRVAARREEQMALTQEHASLGQTEGGRELPLRTDPGRSPESIAGRRLVVRKIAAALARLSPERRRAVGLHLRGFKPPEIARLLSLSEPKARSLVYRGLTELRERLAEEGIEYEAE